MPDRPDWLDDPDYPFADRWLEVGGHRVHYVDEGRGPVLLMLHGNPTWSYVYRHVITALRGQFRCVALDLPGFGLSVAERGYAFTPAEHARVVADVVDTLDLRDVTLVAQDWGGPIGLWAAQQHPDRLAGLVLANTWGWPVGGDLHFELFSRTMGGLVGRELIRRLNLFVNVMVPLGHRTRSLSETELRHYRAPMRTRESRHASAVLPREILRSKAFLADVESALASIGHVPALLLWADGDIAMREQELHRWQQHLPRARTVVLEGVGHYLQSDAPTLFADAISQWHPIRAEGARHSR